MQKFADRLTDLMTRRDSAVCVGLDPRVDRIPAEITDRAHKQHGRTLEGVVEAVRIFCSEVIEAVRESVVAVKPQVAYFERLGWRGLRVYAEVCRVAREAGVLVIADVKRNDIGSTASAYASGWLGQQDFGEGPGRVWEVDALTVNPYLGHDGIDPFIDEAARTGTGLFVLVRTSNESARQLQDVTSDGKKLFERVAEWVDSRADALLGACGYSGLGAVVGATYPEELRQLRSQMPRALFLVPGYGAQGGSAEDVAGAFDSNGMGAVVNASRSIIYAHEKSAETSWQQAVQEAAEEMRGQLNRVRKHR